MFLVAQNQMLQYLIMIKRIIMKIPIREIIKRYSAIFSRRNWMVSFLERKATKDKEEDAVKRSAMTLVSSSSTLFSAVLVMCKEVKTKRQKPKRFAELPRMCCEVLLGIGAL